MEKDKESSSAMHFDTLREGEVLSNFSHRVLMLRELDEAQVSDVWRVISEGFIDINKSSFLRQSLSYEEFLDEAKNHNVLKYLAYSKEDSLEGYESVHCEIEDITWADQELLRRVQAEVAPAEPSFYVGTIVVPKERRGFTASAALLEGSLSQYVRINRLNGGKSVCFFDRAEENHKALVGYIQRKLETSAPSEFNWEIREVDTVYYLPLSPGLLSSREVAPRRRVDLDDHLTKIEKDGNTYYLLRDTRLEEGKVSQDQTEALLALKEEIGEPFGGRVVLETREVGDAQGFLDRQHFFAIIPQPLKK